MYRIQRGLKIICLVAFVLLVGYLIELRIHRLLRCQAALSTMQGIEVAAAPRGGLLGLDPDGYVSVQRNIARFCS